MRYGSLSLALSIIKLRAASWESHRFEGTLATPIKTVSYSLQNGNLLILEVQPQRQSSARSPLAVSSQSRLFQLADVETDISDKIGRKYLIGGAYVLVMVGITLEVIANTTADGNATFFGGKFINGIAIGGLISTVMTYVGEVSHPFFQS